MVFGRDVSKMPCFRSSFLYGISIGLGGGLATFMLTSRPQISMHATMATFTVVTLSYWFTCRYIEFNSSKGDVHILRNANNQIF